MAEQKDESGRSGYLWFVRTDNSRDHGIEANATPEEADMLANMLRRGDLKVVEPKSKGETDGRA